MFPFLNLLAKPSRSGLVLNIVVFVSCVLLMNGLIFSLGWDQSSDDAALRQPYVKPSGVLIAFVWIFLIALMSYARWMLNKLYVPEAGHAQKRITIIMIMCISYALYAIAVKGLLGIYSGLAGNVVILGTLIYTVVVNQKLGFSKVNRLLFPVIGWLVFATTIIMSELAWFDAV